MYCFINQGCIKFFVQLSSVSDDRQSVLKIKDIINTKTIDSVLTFIKAHFGFINHFSFENIK